MNIEEIFNKLADHMIEGINYHNEMSKLHDFLGLYGFALQHIYHALEETRNYHSLLHYYSTHFHKLSKLTLAPAPNIIPETWYKYTTTAVDAGSRKSGLKEIMTRWITWEQDTKTLYQTMYLELNSIGEIAAAQELSKYIIDVTEELKHAEKLFLKIEMSNYDFSLITDWQQPIYKKYKKKIGW